MEWYQAWCLNDLVNPLNPCTPCFLRVSLSFPLFFSPYNGIISNKNCFFNEKRDFYTYAEFCFLARQDFVARATRPFFANGFLPRHFSLVPNRLISQAGNSRHGDICRSGELWWPKTCSLFLHSRHGDICCLSDILPGRILSFGQQILLLIFLFFFHWFMSWSIFSCTIELSKT